MSLHDEYARITPFELILPDEGQAPDLVRAVKEEARGRGVPADELGGFLTLGAVEAFVRGIAGDDADASALHRFGPLAFHAVRFQDADRPLYLLTAHVARYLVEGAPVASPKPPEAAGYLQLPQHLFWTQAAGGGPESVDGIFWSATPTGKLHALCVTGVRPDRPGVGVVPLPAAPLADAETWMELKAREEGADFATELPGADIDALYEIRTAGEVLKLLSRFFAYVEAAPEALQRRPASAAKVAVPGASQSVSPVTDEGPRPSGLDATRVSLVG